MTIQDDLQAYILSQDDKQGAIDAIKALLHALSPNRDMPVDHVRWVALDKVKPNDYNPNSVARIEMQLLAKSIDEDGYTQPIVTIYDPDTDTYVIVDGFHRYFVMVHSEAIRTRCNGLLPIVVINKDINERMASTVRHNRARGKHSVKGMSQMIFNMLDNGWTEAEICNELGMEPEEVLRLKHITGFSKLFADREYNKSWVTRRQVLLKQKYEQESNGTQATDN